MWENHNKYAQCVTNSVFFFEISILSITFADKERLLRGISKYFIISRYHAYLYSLLDSAVIWSENVIRNYPVYITSYTKKII